MRLLQTFLLIICFLFSGISKAQVTFDHPVLTVKYCAEALASFTAPAVQFGLEYRFQPKMAWHNELGYVFNVNGNTIHTQKLNGIRLLTEYRYYLWKTGSSLFDNFYIGASIRYIYWDSERSGTFWRDNYAFQQRVQFGLKEHRAALDLSVGMERQLFSRISMGFGLMLGRGFRIQTSEGIPEDGEIINPGLFSLNILRAGDSSGYVDALIRIHVGFRIQ